MANKEYNYEEFEPTYTMWKNNLSTPQSFLLLKPGRDGSTGKLVKITIDSGEEIQLPSEYDSSIHEVDKQGRIVGGLAPRLTKVGSDNKLLGLLDCEKVDKVAALFEVTKKVIEKEALEKAIAIQMEEGNFKNPVGRPKKD